LPINGAVFEQLDPRRFQNRQPETALSGILSMRGLALDSDIIIG
jgi:hypothetical protein